MQCGKCKKHFTNMYLLDKHMNRKYSCDIIFNCEICGKIFESKLKLDRHINKKNPCERKDNIRSNAEILLNIEMIKLQTIKEKHLNAKEILQLKKQAEIEIIELKTRAALEKITLAEKLKTERKEKTVTHINNVHIENSLQANIQNNLKIEQTFIQNVINFYGENPKIISLKDAAEKLSEDIYADPYLAMKYVDGFETVGELIHNALAGMYTDKTTMPYTCNEKLGTLYEILPNGKKVQLIKREFKDIEALLKPHLYTVLESMNGAAPLANLKTKRGYNQDFDDRIKTIEVTRMNIANVDIQQAVTQAFAI